MKQMTVQEAIEVLSEIRCGYNCFDESEKPYYEALSEAIKALTHFNSDSNSIKNELNELSCSEKPNGSEPKTADSGSVDSEMPEIKTDRTTSGDLISRQDALLELEKWEEEKNWDTWCYAHKDDNYYHITAPTHVIRDLPSAQPERKQGEWIHDGCNFPHGNDWIHCSECGKRGINVPADLTNFCSNCGADMRGDNNV